MAEQHFGRFSQVLSPGFHFLGADACGCCIQLQRISKRVHQTMIVTNTITKDRTAVAIKTAVQQAVRPDRVYEAVYRLDDIERQLSAHVADVVMSCVPLISLDEVYSSFDRIARRVRKHLQDVMRPYGIDIIQALVLEASPNSEVKASMDEVMVQKNLRAAAVSAAEVEKVRLVKSAEADAERMALQGRGMALKREAIAQGLVNCLVGSVGNMLTPRSWVNTRRLSAATLLELLLATEYCDTLKEIGARDKAEVVFTCEASQRHGALSNDRSESKATSRTRPSISTVGSMASASTYGRRPSNFSAASLMSKRSSKRQSVDPALIDAAGGGRQITSIQEQLEEDSSISAGHR